MKRHYKRPNGYGSIYMEKGRRRKPYRVMITTERALVDGKPKLTRKTLGYYESADLAKAALDEYTKNEYDIDKAKMTFAEVYAMWSRDHFPTITPKSQYILQNAYKRLSGLHSVPMAQLRTEHFEGAIRACTAGSATKKKMTQLLSMMSQWAMAHDVTRKDYVKLCNFRIGDTEPQLQRVLFTPEEIQTMRDHTGEDQIQDMILLSIYTGFRPGELLAIKSANVDPVQQTITGGSKTAAGRDRIVPIHPDVRELVEHYLSIGTETLFVGVKSRKKPMPYEYYRDAFVARYPGHTCYDTRHTFVTAWKKQSLNEYILKRIVGHQIGDVSEKFYTHRDIENLKSEMAKLVL